MNGMGVWKDGKSTEQVAREVLRSYLVRCHGSVSLQCLEVQNMAPADAADFLLHLQDTGRINIQLYNQGPSSIGCKITELHPGEDDYE